MFYYKNQRNISYTRVEHTGPCSRQCTKLVARLLPKRTRDEFHRNAIFLELHPHKHVIMGQCRASTGPMLPASDQYWPGTGMYQHVYRDPTDEKHQLITDNSTDNSMAASHHQHTTTVTRYPLQRYISFLVVIYFLWLLCIQFLLFKGLCKAFCCI